MKIDNDFNPFDNGNGWYLSDDTLSTCCEPSAQEPAPWRAYYCDDDESSGRRGYWTLTGDTATATTKWWQVDPSWYTQVFTYKRDEHAGNTEACSVTNDEFLFEFVAQDLVNASSCHGFVVRSRQTDHRLYAGQSSYTINAKDDLPGDVIIFQYCIGADCTTLPPNDMSACTRAS